MSFGEPNNPYSQPPQQAPGQGYPPPPQNAPGGYGYPQAPQSPPGYGYPQQGGYPAYPGYPGGNMMPYSMPGLMVTARVFLFIIAAVQIILGLGLLYAAATVNDLSNANEDIFGNNFGSSLGHDAAGVLGVLAFVFLALSALSITLGVKFGSGRQGVRITTMVYGILGTLVGVLALVNATNVHSAVALISALLWVVFGGIIASAMMVAPSTAWFNRPRY